VALDLIPSNTTTKKKKKKRKEGRSKERERERERERKPFCDLFLVVLANCNTKSDV
jgi:hypothetical protein